MRRAEVAAMPRSAGWVVLTQLIIEIAALKAMLLATAESGSKRQETPSRSEALPAFITEIADNDARRYRLRTQSGPLYAGFYSDGRVRLATLDGCRYSGVAVDKKVVMAALRDDVSFEMVMATSDSDLSLEISGGPYDGQTLHCEPIA